MSVSHQSRNAFPRLDLLISDCEQAHDDVREILSVPISTLKDDIGELKSLIVGIKKCSTHYFELCHNVICSLNRCASLQQANEFKAQKVTVRAEVRQRINDLISYLENLGVSDAISNINSNSVYGDGHGGREGSVLGDFSTENLVVTSIRSGLGQTGLSLAESSRVSTCNNHLLSSTDNVIPLENLDFGKLNVCSSVGSSLNGGADVSSCQALPPVVLGRENCLSVIHSKPSIGLLASHTSRSLGSLAASPSVQQLSGRSSESFLTQRPTVSFRPPSILAQSHPLRTHSFGPQTSKVGSTSAYLFGSDSQPFVQRSHSLSRPFASSSDSNTHSYNLHERSLGPSNLSFGPSNLPPSNFQRQSSHNYFSNLNPPNPSPIVVNDSAGFHILKQQLFQKSADPFSGDPESFNSWMHALQNKIEGLNLSAWDMLLILEANTTKEPLRIVQKHIAIGGPDLDNTLERAVAELKTEFGSSIRLANALNSKVDSFPPIRSIYHTDKLKELLTLCQHIEANLNSSDELQIFNSSYGARRIWLKLPENLQNSWRSACDDFRLRNYDRYPNLSFFVGFLSKKIREYTDPLLQRPSFPSKTTTLKTDALPQAMDPSLPESKQNAQPSVLVRCSATSKITGCPLHEQGNHSLEQCRKFSKLPQKDKRATHKTHGLCFLCFGRHVKSKCTSGQSCDHCKGSHHTLLHLEPQKEKVNSEKVESNLCTTICGSSNSSKSCSKTLLVDLSIEGQPGLTLRCYAILDEQSSSSFADPKVASFFGLSGPVSDYSLSTLSGSTTKTQGVVIKGLKVKGINEKRRHFLPLVYTNPFIPDSKSEVADPQIVGKFSHLRHLAKNFSEVDGSAEVMLLLGRDAGSCMFTRCYGNKSPFAHHTALGWALVGSCCVSDNIQSNHSVLRVNLYENFSQTPCFSPDKKWNLPDVDIFEEKKDDECPGLSQEDCRFLQIVHSGISLNADGSLVLPLPFKLTDPILPDNHSEVFCRTRSSLGRLTRDRDKLDQCLQVMGKYLSLGHVEMVPSAELTPKQPGHAWWIPVFPVTHPKKGKVRIVFDSSAKYHGTCLNDHLLSGPDINNRLRDVLIGFRNGTVGFSADVESMFHNFLLKVDQQDYIRFFWFQNNDSSQGICQFRARVHIFGNCSSPALASLGLRFAVDRSSNLEHVWSFVNEQFYVDDGLSCAGSVEDAVRVLKDTVDALSKSNIRLHKICSSSPDVVNAFPESERALSSSIDLKESSNQSALGLTWDVVRDCIVIRSEVPDRCFTRRGVLATVNAVFDPLGISAPVVLEGKLLLREFLSSSDESASVSSAEWDEELPDSRRPAWDVWKQSLSQLSGLNLPRSYRPKGFGNPVVVQLHDFAMPPLRVQALLYTFVQPM